MKKELIGLAGEMRVCAELLKKGFFATITHGNAKATDVLVFDDQSDRFLRVEVKTSKNGRNFVTGFYPKYTDPAKTHPDLWVFYIPDRDLSVHGDRFYLVAHDDVARIQLIVNKGNKTLAGMGCDNIPLKVLDEEVKEGDWELPRRLLARP